VSLEGERLRKGMTARELLWVGAAIGLSTGVVEVAFRGVERLVSGRQLHVSAQIVWMAPLADFILALLISGGLLTLALVVGRRVRPRLAIGVLLLPLTFGLSLQVPRVHIVAALVLAAGASKLLSDRLGHRIAPLKLWSRRVTIVLVGSVGAAGVAVNMASRVRESVAVSALPMAGEQPNILLLVLDTVRSIRPGRPHRGRYHRTPRCSPAAGITNCLSTS